MDYERWAAEHLFLLVPAQQYVGQFLSTFKEFPPRQKAASFSIDQVLEALQAGSAGQGSN
jgi:arylsulfatase